MKINYVKSKVFSVGLTVEEGQKVADNFNCKLGTFPMKYLGLPINDRRLSKIELSDSAMKIEKEYKRGSVGIYPMGVNMYPDQLQFH
jgi:hypothetical protein